jgi:thiol:disulfide interchange protein DsbA
MAMFRAMHEDGKRMRSEAEIREFVDSLGLDGEEFVGAMNSLGVNTRMQRARDLQQTYGVSGTPSVVIDGRYITSGSQAGSFERMIQVIDERVAAARGERD